MDFAKETDVRFIAKNGLNEGNYGEVMSDLPQPSYLWGVNIGLLYLKWNLSKL